MFKRAGLTIVLAACVSAPAWGFTVVSTPTSFGSGSWVVNEIFVDNTGVEFTNGGLFVDVQPASIYQQPSGLTGGDITLRQPGQTLFVGFPPPGVTYDELSSTLDPDQTLQFDSHVSNGTGDPHSEATAAGKSGLGSFVDPLVPVFDVDNIDIGWLQFGGGGGTGPSVKIAQVTLKVSANGKAYVESFAGSPDGSPQDEAVYDIIDGVINPSTVPVVPVPAAALAGLPLLGLAGIIRRRWIG